MKNKKIALFLLAGGFCATAFCAEFDPAINKLLPDDIRKSGVVRVASPRQLPPNVYEVNGVLQGEAPDLMRAVEPILGVKFDFADVQWPGVLPGIQSGRYDMSIGSVTYARDREASFNMVVYRSNTEGVLAKADRRGEPITSGMQLCGKTVGTVQGSSLNYLVAQQSTECLKSGQKEVTVKTYPSVGLALLAVKAGNLEFFPDSYGSLSYVAARSNGEFTVYFIPNWRGLPQAAAIAKNKPGLAEALVMALQRLHDTGEYQSILKKYNLQSTAIEKASIKMNPGVDMSNRIVQ